MTIIFVCFSCQGYNKHQRGNEDFEERETTFTSFSEAWQHMNHNPDHWMDAEIDESEDEE